MFDNKSVHDPLDEWFCEKKLSVKMKYTKHI